MRTRAVILKKQNTNEYDQLITCYTEEFGKLTAVAKGVLKSGSIQAMHLNVFNLVDFELVNGRAMSIITGTQAENTYPTLKNRLASLATGYFFIEVVDKLFFDYQKDNEIWNFLLELLEDLNKDSPSFDEILKTKKGQLVSILGYAPNISQCAFCLNGNQAELIAYSVHARGVVCQNCFLSGQEAIVIKGRNFGSDFIAETIIESIMERKINSSNFLKTVLE